MLEKGFYYKKVPLFESYSPLLEERISKARRNSVDNSYFPALPHTFILSITYFLTSSRPAALYFLGSMVSGFQQNSVTPLVMRYGDRLHNSLYRYRV